MMQSDLHNGPFRIPSDWKIKSKLLRRRYPQLTQSDVSDENVDGESLLKKIAARLDMKSADVIQIIRNTIPNKFINNLKIHYHE